MYLLLCQTCYKRESFVINFLKKEKACLLLLTMQSYQSNFFCGVLTAHSRNSLKLVSNYMFKDVWL